jgi:hypothetical protein
MPLTWRTQTLYMSGAWKCHRAPENFRRPPAPRNYNLDWAAHRPISAAMGLRLARKSNRPEWSSYGLLDCHE